MAKEQLHYLDLSIVQNALSKSNEVFETYKQEIEKVDSSLFPLTDAGGFY